ncbi:acyltransferase family protein [Streptococcus suis]|uniref:Acyltransferase n=1 Tax=Streptococcus suis TaxID=1307 RepID=A0A0F6UXE0_STRSU|nr:acyltransferase family protein [Streptococcus suis]AKE80185.1 acyltransferase [Streptococcus suis]NQN57498.1 acyltransferase family protein [Streptococcus suis]NQS32228.1 acyltransferase family protein [Streptococcus suis]CYX72307.1 Fucose 4-O-acetylase and related acetyltransferases [Streptococcus suis]
MNTRIQWIDNLKGIGILLVVLGHTSFPFKNYIFWIHMPLFFALTGMTFNPTKNLKTLLFSRFNSLIVPFLTFGFFFLFLNHFANLSLLFREAMKFLIYGGVKSSGIMGAFWFLPTLFLSEFIFYCLVKNIKRHKTLVVVFICTLFPISYFGVYRILPYNLTMIPYILLYMWIGYHFKNGFNTERGNKTLLILGSSLCMLLGYFVSFKLDLKYAIVSNWFLGLILPAVVLLTIFTYSKQVLERLKPKVILYLGQNSLVVLLVHNYYRFFLEEHITKNWGVVFWITLTCSLLTIKVCQTKIIKRIMFNKL